MREANQKYANAHKAEISENKRRYYQEHREEILALRSPYYFENKDVLLAYRKRYYEENRGRALANKAEYNKTHRSERRAIENKRRARKKNNGGSHAAADIRAQYNEQDGLCLYCGREVGDQYHVDHYIPLAAGGGNGPDNIVIACPRCNCAKQDSHPEEFLARLVP
jgi:5-methylcytosine-specific restriction endonuclease McrA